MEAYPETRRPKRKRKVPEYLVAEILDGRPLYYIGYEKVLSGKKQPEEIMGASGLQMELVAYLFKLLILALNKKKYKVYGGESGLHLSHRNNLSGDVCIFDRTVLTNEKITTKYIDVPPKIVLEVDMHVDVSEVGSTNYILTKTQHLLDFGTEKIIWIFTKNKKILIAEPKQNWYYTDWDNDVEIMAGITFNMAKYLEDEGIKLEEDL